ncbi:MAG: hypothetical protein OEU26_00055 [Candidatus Tectomicrobia bacterium]|nr:hypothetical protein [Candidatus Tectomicrobia bacterium]
MASHRWSNLTRAISRFTPRQKIKFGLVVTGIILLLTLMSYGYFKPDLEQSMKIHQNEKEPEELKTVTLGQDATYMGQVARQLSEQNAQAADIKTLKNLNEELKTKLDQALAAGRTKPKLSAVDVQRMIDQNLAAARAAQQVRTPAASPPPPKPVLLSKFEPPPRPAPEVPKGNNSPAAGAKRPEMAVPIPAGSSALGIALNGFLAQSNDKHESVAVELISHLTGPNGSTVPLRGCRMVAECEAIDIIARGRCEITVMTCTLPRHELVDIPISGWLTAEDNVNATFGTTFWNNEQLFKRIGEAALPAILAEILDLTTTTVQATSPTGVVTTGTTSPLSDFSLELSELLLNRVRLFIFPIVAVDRNQRVNVYIRETAYATGTLPGDWVHQQVRRPHPYH